MNYLKAKELLRVSYDKTRGEVVSGVGRVLTNYNDTLEYFHDLTCKETDTEGYMIKTVLEGLVYIFPGTESWKDIVTDAKIIRLPYKVNGKTVGWMCRGFRKAIYSIKPAIQKMHSREMIRNRLKGKFDAHITILGHSLGAVLARGCADSIYEIDQYNKRVVITMGEPGGFTKKSARLYAERNPWLIRIVNHGDPIIGLPPLSKMPRAMRTVELGLGKRGHGLDDYDSGLKAAGY